MENPKVSIITCTFGERQEILNRAIESILEQDYWNWECIVVNDGGMRPFVPNDSRFRVIDTEHHGQPHAFNVGINAASGEVITFLDDDDKFYPHNISTKVKALNVAGTDLVYLPVNSIREGKPPSADWGRFPWEKYEVLIGNCAPNLGIAMRRDVFSRVGPFGEQWWTHHDWEWQLRAVHNGISGSFWDCEPAGEYQLSPSGDAKRQRARRIGLQQQIRALYTDTALVAIIMPLHQMDKERIARAVDSVYNQGMTWWHLYMVYDGEPEPQHFYEPNPQVNTTIHIMPRNGGVGHARAVGISLGNERIIGYLDGDDFFAGGHLWEGVHAMREHDFVFFKSVAFGAWDHPALKREERMANMATHRGILPPHIYWRPENLHLHNVMITCGVLHTRALYNKTAGWRTEEGFSDWSMWKRLAYHARPVHIDTITSEYEVREESTSCLRKKRMGLI